MYLTDVNDAVCLDVVVEKKKARRATKNTFCYCCKTRLFLSDHHLKPRSEGGTDDPDNLVTVCRDCHDIVEGPYEGAWERVVHHKESIKAGQIAKTKEERVREAREWREKQQDYDRELRDRKAKLFELAGGAAADAPVPLSLSELTAKRRAQGFLDAVDGRRYWSLAFGEEQARLLFDAPLQDWVENIVDRACGRGTWRKQYDRGESIFSPEPPEIPLGSPENAPDEPDAALNTQGTPLQPLQNVQALLNGGGIGENPRLGA
jgi:hypothetical protein